MAQPSGIAPATATGVARLALGTAQFGMSYGVANAAGQVSAAQAEAILQCAFAAGIDTLDTAVAYGTSEEVLGSAGLAGWRVVTKLPPIPENCPDVRGWATREVDASLGRLRIGQLHGLLVHHTPDLQGPRGVELADALGELRVAGRARKIGVSIYDPHDLTSIAARFHLEIVQAPLNPIDHRLADSGWLSKLSSAGVEVHVRSAFLQGLLLMSEEKRPRYFRRWDPTWKAWRGWLEASGQSPLEACLADVLAEGAVDKTVVGVDSVSQLEQIISAAARPVSSAPAALHSADVELINPARWPRE